MQSDAKTVSEYLKSLPEERQVAIQTVRQVILDNLPEGYEEVMNWGMITYQVPLEQYPDTYNKKPLMYAALASQKNHMSVYLTGIYMEDSAREEFESSYKATGKRYDVGKSCVRFRKAGRPAPGTDRGKYCPIPHAGICRTGTFDLFRPHIPQEDLSRFPVYINIEDLQVNQRWRSFVPVI